LLESGTQRNFGNKSMTHIDPNTLFVHPSFPVFGVVVQVWWIFMTWSRGLIQSTIGPQLVSEKKSSALNSE
jgi:hypothetical protein